MGLENDVTHIKKMVEAGRIFKPATPVEIGNRPKSPERYLRVESLEQLRTLAVNGVEAFIMLNGGIRASYYISSSSDNAVHPFWYESYVDGGEGWNIKRTNIPDAIRRGAFFIDRENSELPESVQVNEATPKKRIFKPASPENLIVRADQEKQRKEAEQKEREAWYAANPEGMPWYEKARRELSHALNVEIDFSDFGRDLDDGGVAMQANGKGNNGESEWAVYENEDSAEQAALVQIRRDLDDDPTLFSQSWLEQFLSVSDTDRRMISQEESDYLVDESYDDAYILEEAGSADEYQELQNQMDELDSGSGEYEALEQQQQALLDAAKETVRESEYDKIYDALADPIEYFANERGMYSTEDLIKQHFVHIDVDAAAQQAINDDGVAHFLDRYDGSEIELPGGAIAYGTN